MNRVSLLRAFTAFAAWAVLAGLASADRTPTMRTSGVRNTGTRPDITVPYLNNGTNAFHAANVHPRIYASPNVGDPNSPPTKPIFNLIFYGSTQGFGDKSNGAGPRPANVLRPQKSP
ncbi:MAG TPA: hypothetical protein VKE94_10365 [Gemmataceae bacterium]|nr:hypothetical protein [Gemmataceae bacterium]